MNLLLFIFLFCLKAFSSSYLTDPFKHSGYVEVDVNSHTNIFYWFFESQNGKKDSPIILWLQGGPGCTGMMGLFGENGPYILLDSQELVINPFSWNVDFHLLYVDSPVGTGFSYEDSPHSTQLSERDVSSTLYKFLDIFFSKMFYEYSKNPFFIFGESYGGKYVPSLAWYIDTHPSNIFHLEGFGVANGLCDPQIQSQYFAEFGFQTGLLGLEQKKQVESLQKSTFDAIQSENWEVAAELWNKLGFIFESWSGWPNPSDIREYGFASLNYTNVIKYINSPEIRKQLGVGNHTFSSICNNDVSKRMIIDSCKSIKSFMPHLLKRYRTLFLNGNFDPTIPAASHEAWLNSIEWGKQSQFVSSPRQIWQYKGQTAGYSRKVDNLWHMVIVQAGHMAAADQRERVQSLITDFINNIIPKDLK